MDIEPSHLAVIVAAAVGANQVLAALRQWGVARFREGRDEGEEAAGVAALRSRVNGIDKLHELKMPQFEQVRIDVAANSADIRSLTRSVDILVGENRETNRSIRIMATALGIKLIERGDLPELRRGGGG